MRMRTATRPSSADRAVPIRGTCGTTRATTRSTPGSSARRCSSRCWAPRRRCSSRIRPSGAPTSCPRDVSCWIRRSSWRQRSSRSSPASGSGSRDGGSISSSPPGSASPPRAPSPSRSCRCSGESRRTRREAWAALGARVLAAALIALAPVVRGGRIAAPGRALSIAVGMVVLALLAVWGPLHAAGDGLKALDPAFERGAAVRALADAVRPRAARAARRDRLRACATATTGRISTAGWRSAQR